MRRPLTIVVALVTLLLVVTAGAGWFYADQILAKAPPPEPTYDIEVAAIDDTTITLQGSADTADYEQRDLVTDLIVGFETADGYLRLTDLEDVSGELRSTWRYELVSGSVPARSDLGELDVYAYPDDPGVLGLEVEEVAVPGPLGDLPAWLFPGPSDTWVVFVHGRTATRAEALRAVDIVHDAGHPALVVTYRNDPGAPESVDGFSHYGGTEWRDVQAAVDWLQETRGARRVVPFGFSQGGAIVATMLRNTADGDAIPGAVLDSPLLSLHQTLGLQARARGVPGPVVPPLLVVAKAIADVRGGLDFAAREHVAAAEELTTPLLVFHGRDDHAVPFGPSARLADARPDLVTFVPYDGDHVRGWNTDPERYATDVTDFLERVTTS